jgi:hypothetical protein
MDDDAPPEPARSAGGSNVSSLQPQPAEADEDDVISGASEESDGRAMAVEVEQPVMQAHHVRVAAPASEAGPTPRCRARAPLAHSIGGDMGMRGWLGACPPASAPSLPRSPARHLFPREQLRRFFSREGPSSLEAEPLQGCAGMLGLGWSATARRPYDGRLVASVPTQHDLHRTRSRRARHAPSPGASRPGGKLVGSRASRVTPMRCESRPLRGVCDSECFC